MFTHYRNLGFILKKTDRGEVNRIFTIYTKDFGKLELLAKAGRKIKSKLRGGLELFYLSEIEFIQGKTHKTLTDAFLVESFRFLRGDLERLKIAYQIAEVLDKLLKGEERDEKTWDLLNETFQKLNTYSLKPKTYNLIYYCFFWNFFSILGYQPELYNCSICQKKLAPGELYWSSKEGGVICGNCFKKSKTSLVNIDPNVVKILRLFLKKDWNILKKLKIAPIYSKTLKTISEGYLNQTLEEVK